MTVSEVLGSGCFQVVSEGGLVECVNTAREARELATSLRDQGYNAYVQDLSPELAAL